MFQKSLAILKNIESALRVLSKAVNLQIRPIGLNIELSYGKYKTGRNYLSYTREPIEGTFEILLTSDTHISDEGQDKNSMQ